MDFDDLSIGSGMAGLAVGALLARKGRKVAVLEAHDVPGGYAHTFRMKEYRFCAQVHCIFNCVALPARRSRAPLRRPAPTP